MLLGLGSFRKIALSDCRRGSLFGLPELGASGAKRRLRAGGGQVSSMIYVHSRSFTAAFALAASALLLVTPAPARTDPGATATRARVFRPPVRPALPKV